MTKWKVLLFIWRGEIPRGNKVQNGQDYYSLKDVKYQEELTGKLGSTYVFLNGIFV